MFTVLDIIGTIAFAMSGAVTAMNKKMDIFGVFIIAFVAALGGGTLRDILIGITPVTWMQNYEYVYVIIIAFALSIIFRRKFDRLRTSLFFFDTIGLGVFTIIGLQKGVENGLHPIICISLGTMTACFGGVIRDILCNEIPVIFRKEIYATLCIIGGILFFILQKTRIEPEIITIITASVIITLRLLVVKYNLKLPNLSS